MTTKLTHKVNKGMMLLSFIGVVCTALIFTTFFYTQTVNYEKDFIRKAAQVMRAYPTEQLMAVAPDDMRVTLVDADGTVIYDNAAEASTMASHSDRREIMSAFSTGMGEAERYSSTLGQGTYYYAIRLASGEVLRVSKPISSMGTFFLNSVPYIIGMSTLLFILCIFVSRKITQEIVTPINQFNFFVPTPIYKELEPFVAYIRKQKSQLEWAMQNEAHRKKEMETIIQQLDEGLLLADSEGMIVSVNKQAEKILQLSPHRSGNTHVDMIANQEIREGLQKALNKEPSQQLLAQDGTIYQVFFSGVEESGVLVLFLDVTEKQRAEKLRREFTANVSHELKTPLTTISGFAELMANGLVKDEDVRMIANKMKKESERLIHLIDETIRLSELDENATGLLVEDVQLSEVIEDVLESLERKVSEKGIVVETAVDKDILIAADRRMMFEMFYNLIENGIKYNKPAGQLRIAVASTADNVTIQVTDSGIGIDAANFHRIFERFYRVDKSRSQQVTGTGLGLAIVKHIVLQHHGTITVDSQKNESTTFTIQLPKTHVAR